MKYLLYLLFSLLSFSSFSQVETTITVPTGTSPSTFQALLYLPDDYNTSGNNYPLLVFLHGSGESCSPLSTIYNSTTAGGPSYFIEHGQWPTTGFVNPKDGKTYKFIVVSPQSACNSWSSSGDELDSIVSYLKKTYRVDANRCYATGLSSGGGGVIEHIAHLDAATETSTTQPRKNKFAAVVPMSLATITPVQSWANVSMKDSVRVWGFGDQNNDTYGSNTQLYLQLCDNVKIGYTRFTGNPGSNGLNTFNTGHGPWNPYYNPTYRENFTFQGVTSNMNIYEWMLISTLNTVAPVTPTANAGINQSITLPTSSITFAGAGTGGTGHTVSSYLVTKVLGNSATITTPSSPTTAITGLTAGHYIFQLTVTNDQSNQATSQMNVTVLSSVTYGSPTNSTTPPSQTITLPTNSATASSPSVLTGATQVSQQWTKFKTPSSTPLTAAFIGSSTTAGTGATVSDSSFVGIFTNYYVAQGIFSSTASVTNLGVSGYNLYNAMPTGYVAPSSVTSVLSGANNATIDPNANITKALSTNPKVIIINFPSNAYDQLLIGDIMAGYQILYNAAVAGGAVCYITTTQPREDFSSSNQTFLQTVRDSILIRFGSHALNFYDAVTIPGTTQRLYPYASDLIHENNGGHRQFGNTVIGANVFQTFQTSTSSISAPTSTTTNFTNLVTGIHVFQSTVMDTHGQSTSSLATVVVNPGSSPIANAGSNQTITLPTSSVSLSGSASSGTITSYLWTKVSGGAATITSPSTVNTTVTGLVAGTYTFQLSVNSGVSTSTVTITVNSNNGSYPACGSHRRLVLTPGGDGGVYINVPDVYGYQPGDTLIVEGGTYFEFDQFKGNPSCPLVIKNDVGQRLLTQSIKLDGSTYVQVTGTGDPNVFYGIKIEADPQIRNQGPPAIDIVDRSKNVEVDHIFAHNVDIGIVCETNADCADSLNYAGGWILDSMRFHDIKIQGTWNEGMYIGNTSPDNAPYDPRPVTCNGVTSYPPPMKNGRTWVYNCIVDSTGRSGIQLANCIATSGISQVYNNVVKHNGLNGDDAQGNSINLGLYTQANVYNNTLINQLVWAIAMIGACGDSTLQIHDNITDSSGFLVNYPAIATTPNSSYDPRTEPTAPDPFTYPYVIWSATRTRVRTTDNPAGTAVPGHDSTWFIIKNNTIGIWKSFTSSTDNHAPIQIEDDTQNGQRVSSSTICNNTSSKGQPITIYTGSIPHAYSYNSSCTGLPIVSAGTNQTVNLPTSTVTLAGSATPVSGHTITSYQWQTTQGPNAPTYNNSTLAGPTITGLIAGNYTFTLTATQDDGNFATSSVGVTVFPVVIPPTVSAGSNQTLTLPTNSLTLTGGASGNAGASIISQVWTLLSGPSATITSPNSLSTNVTLTVAGTYVFQLSATQLNLNGTTTSNNSTVTITLNNIPGFQGNKILKARGYYRTWKQIR